MEVKEKKRFYQYFFLTAVVCGGLVCVVFALRDYFPGQKITFTYGDYYAQYYPVTVHFWDSLFKGKSLSFSFATSMGLPTMAMYACVAMSPFGILLYLIRDLETASFLIFVIKMMLAAAFFWIFAVRQLKSGFREALYFANVYALSAFSLSFFVNIHFMDVLYIAPILGICMMRYVHKNRRIGLVLVYAFSFINMFLTGYSLGIFSFVVFLSVVWYLRIEKRRLGRLLIGYFVIVFVAGLLSMAVILPIASFVKNHMASGSSFSRISLIDLFELPMAYMINTSNGSIFNTRPVFYCGWPVLIMVIIYFLNSNITKREKIMSAWPLVFLLLCTLWHPAYLMMHAFDEPDSFAWRFSYLLVFAFVTIACRSYAAFHGQPDKKTVLTSAGVLFFSTIFSVIYSKIKYGNPMITGIVIVLNLLCIVIAATVITVRKGFVIYGLVELIVSALVMIPNFEEQGDFLQSSQKAEIDRVESGINEIKSRESEQEFWRIAVDYGNTYNFSMLFDYNSNTFFSSLEDSRLWKTMHQLGYFARAQQISYFGATDFTDMLFSIRYCLEEGIDGENMVTRNEMALPLVFCVSDRILEYSGTEDPFESQNLLATCMMAENVRLFSNTEQTIIPGNGMNWGWNEEKQVYQAQKTGDDSSLVWVAETSGDKEAFTYCLKENLSAGFGENTFLVSGIPGVCGSDTAIPLSGGSIVSMYEMPGTGKSVATIFMAGQNGEVFEYKDMLCATLDLEVLKRVYHALAEGGIRISAYQDGRVEGYIRMPEEHPVLFTSIPYDPGWEVYVDGLKTETFAVMDGTFLAARAEAGDHQIELKYRDRSLYVGICCSIVGMLLLGGMVLFEQRQSKNENKKTEEQV